MIRGYVPEGRRSKITHISEQAGLATASDLNLTAREDAVGALVSLAHLRQRRLVAGSEEPPSQPTGAARLPEVAFTPRPDDAPVYVLAPSSIPSDSLASRIQAVAGGGAQIRLVHDATEIPREGPPPLVLNWGSTQGLPDDLVALIQPEAVRVASDQVASLVRLRELAPRTVLNPEDIRFWAGSASWRSSATGGPKQREGGAAGQRCGLRPRELRSLPAVHLRP